MKRTVVYLAFIYLIMLLIGGCLIQFGQGSHWLLTLFLFGPRWTVAAPLLLLVPITLILHFRLTWIYLLHGLVIVFLIMGFEVVGLRTGPFRPAIHARMMTCNLGGGTIDAEEIINRVRAAEIELLMLQECPPGVANSVFEQLGWNHCQEGNIAMGSVFPVGRPQVLARHPETHYHAVAAVSCDIEMRSSGSEESRTAQLVCVHLPTFRPALQAARRFDVNSRAEFHAVAIRYRNLVGRLHEELDPLGKPTIVAGDFNVPVESAFYREFWDEFQNAFDQAGIGLGYTKYTRYHGIRIDHVLADRQWHVESAAVGAGLGGDHRPVIVAVSLAN